ncbi:MAG: ATP-dependent DNA helicase RecQ, partial [Methylococcaceae bacterium]|nr:ATP-dependent DNA helicase RecQ [Methylococcaceae bacterium]
VYGLQDVITLRSMVESSEADEQHKRTERHKLDAMLGFCELAGCRRQALLQYFGDLMDRPCGNCDNCLQPVETWDASEPARKALSCVYRSGQRYGAHYVIDLLLGKANERVRSLGHDRLTTYGIGRELDDKQWLSVFRQLIGRGYLNVDLEAYGALRLHESARPVLRGEEAVRLRRDAEPEPRRSKDARRTPARFTSSSDERLWQALRLVRRRLADEQGVPPYVILHDVVLQEMVDQRPQSLEHLALLPGIGERKLERYGTDFLEAIQAADPASEPVSALSSADESLSLFRLGMTVERIAAQRGLTPSTVLGHLTQAVEQGLAEACEVVGMGREEAGRLEAGWRALPESDQLRLQPLYEALEGAYDYGVLRCLRASWLRAGIR